VDYPVAVPWNLTKEAARQLIEQVPPMVGSATFKTIQQAVNLPVILAGGLNPANIRQIIQNTAPYAVDVLTGSEERPGRKDPNKINQFMQGVSSASLTK